MMAFRTLKASLVSLLGLAAAGRFRVVGYQPQGSAIEEVKGNLRMVQVYFSGGQIPKSGGGSLGPVAHDVTFKLELTAAKASEGDLAPLMNPASTPAQFAAALASFTSAAELADESMDELLEIVFQILMDGRNLDLGLAPGNVANRWIERIDKGEPSPRGELVVVSGSMDLTCRVAEALLGDAGVPSDPVLGAAFGLIETNMPESTSADAAPASVRGGGI
jgi:hypothetical protein